jgi:hypothetical protein
MGSELVGLNTGLENKSLGLNLLELGDLTLLKEAIVAVIVEQPVGPHGMPSEIGDHGESG